MIRKWITAYKAWRRLRLIEKCDAAGHALQGTIMPSGAPGKMCETCHYAVELTRKEFKKLFGITPDTALARAARRGHKVENAAKYLGKR